MSPVVPEVVNLHLTSVCNLHCVYCFGQFPGTSRPPPGVDWAGVIDVLAREGVKRVNFSGGEPTLVPNLPALLDHARGLGLSTSIVTNCKRLSDGVIRRCDIVALSIDSADASTNHRLGRVLSGGGSYEAFICILAQQVRRLGRCLKLNTVVTRLNVDQDLSALYRALMPDKVKLLQFRRVVGENDAQAAELEVTDSEFARFVARHAPLKAEGIWVQPESEATIASTYAMVDPEGRVFQHSADGRHRLSRPVLEVGLMAALAEAGGYNREGFLARGGAVDLRTVGGGR